jgi:hypothetical protein
MRIAPRSRRVLGRTGVGPAPHHIAAAGRDVLIAVHGSGRVVALRGDRKPAVSIRARAGPDGPALGMNDTRRSRQGLRVMQTRGPMVTELASGKDEARVCRWALDQLARRSCFYGRLLHKAVSEKVPPPRGSGCQSCRAHPCGEPQLARDERLGHFRSPALERIQRARRGFVQQPHGQARASPTLADSSRMRILRPVLLVVPERAPGSGPVALLLS